MASFFYSTKTADAVTHQLPLSLDRERALDVLHNETLAPRIFWPSTVMANRRQTSSGLEGVLSDSGVGVSLLPLADGVTCVEKIGGFTITVSYSILDGEAPGDSHGGKSHGLRLREERSIRALRPIASLAKFKNESPAKTQHLVRFLQAFSENGADVMAALECIAVADVHDKRKEG